jgi:hypothetical protein
VKREGTFYSYPGASATVVLRETMCLAQPLQGRDEIQDISGICCAMWRPGLGFYSCLIGKCLRVMRCGDTVIVAYSCAHGPHLWHMLMENPI